MNNISKDDKLILTHFAEEPEHYMNAVVPPVFFTSLHVFPNYDQYSKCTNAKDDDFVYGRVSNPTTSILERKLAALEHGKNALFFSAGMAATTTGIMTVCDAGDHIICVKNSYSAVRDYLDKICIPQLKMEVTYVKGDDLDEIERAIRPNTKLFYLESPTSLVMTLCDLKGIAKLAKKYNFKTLIDNTCGTPLYQKPLDMGIDMVMHAASKYLGGHSDLIGGALVMNDDTLFDKAYFWRNVRGSILAPMEAWLILRGIRTLDVRLERHSASAYQVASFLENHPKVTKVYYPALQSSPQYELYKKQQTGCTGLISFECDSDYDGIVRMIDTLKLFKIGCSWGGFESLILMGVEKGTKEEQEFEGCGENLIRIHVGLEGAENLIEDLENALKMI